MCFYIKSTHVFNAYYKQMRKRKLSDDGLTLFNIALHKHPEAQCIKSGIKCYGKIKQLLLKMWTTEYDIELNTAKKNLRNSSKSLYRYLQNDGDMIPAFIDNAIINIIMLILTKDSQLCTYNQIKMNYGFYCNLALKAQMEKDHHTALLLSCALQHYCFDMLKIKPKYYEKLHQLAETYGSPLTCYSKHMKEFLKVDDFEYLPSVMIMQMQLKKAQEQSKGLKFVKRNSKNLDMLKQSLSQKVEDYYTHYKNNQDLIDIYNLNPLHQFDLLLSSKGDKITTKLFDLVGNIKIKNKK